MNPQILRKHGEDMLAADVLSSKCPSRRVLSHLTSRWGVLVMVALMLDGQQRFSTLRRRVDGVSERMLAQTLQALEADGIVQRIDFKTVPPHVEYVLTPIGHEAAEKVTALAGWAEDNLDRLLAAAQSGATRDASNIVQLSGETHTEMS
ncbi:winged helix-turn-helix transcriptional regulator [Ketogulonicigenium vulgare]|uniref:Transcriptional regulator, HxlR family protein n=1 Tax=Ketogulonicigenium vulgare (strain WSH-001) TaxID=759362 RepID=F9Y702_KETVW|nr:helix-turn-helix domain-containing protein [Ketogulonicigenium vulgare]ADO43941.1 HTH-type transcriptional regulator ytfH [Ketogulonicigenium vulgare Y25]AEM42192.1 transcriptional regulator, HxlR family protein [Ketogulonicigenium vulgare WSH-001]ALJ79816.1 transcriptional regulator [Ketogulonicigenium vulgare]ANW32731.1 transcriptional regulator [Ketogulonicigenium vulgare]AOZ55972.1 HTH-type transcriptional regulator ytfH [Ketogulonicigenium vulgare]